MRAPSTNAVIAHGEDMVGDLIWVALLRAPAYWEQASTAAPFKPRGVGDVRRVGLGARWQVFGKYRIPSVQPISAIMALSAPGSASA
jgi:hypothetical protein